MLLQRVPQVTPRFKPVQILTAHALALKETAPFQVNYDPLDSPLRDLHLRRDISNADAGPEKDAMQDMGVIAQKRPVGGLQLGHHVGHVPDRARPRALCRFARRSATNATSRNPCHDFILRFTLGQSTRRTHARNKNLQHRPPARLVSATLQGLNVVYSASHFKISRLDASGLCCDADDRRDRFNPPSPFEVSPLPHEFGVPHRKVYDRCVLPDNSESIARISQLLAAVRFALTVRDKSVRVRHLSRTTHRAGID